MLRGRSVVSSAVARTRSLPRNHTFSTTTASRDLIRDLEHSDGTPKATYDCTIIGAGHNGLIAGTYLQKAGLNVCILEKRHTIGGAAVTEEIIPGFKFSRASYLLSLLRPKVMNDLNLKKYGLRLYFRDPNSYTPLRGLPSSGPTSLLLGGNEQQNYEQIAQFSQKDAKAFGEYERKLNILVDALSPLLDSGPIHLPTWTHKGLLTKKQDLPSMMALLKTVRGLNSEISSFYELLTAPASTVLNKWFESEPLKATLATDAVIGAMTSPEMPGSGYVLLHHVMGELEGKKGAWAYVEGGMGAVSLAIARAARDQGAHIFTNMAVDKVDVGPDNRARGVVMADGTEIRSKIVLSNTTPQLTFNTLIDEKLLPDKFVTNLSHVDYTSPVTKINLAVDKLPNFLANPNSKASSEPMPHHRTTIHINCEQTGLIKEAYDDAAVYGRYSRTPVIEMTIPSSLDPTVAPPGQHVVQLFTQYTPYVLAGGQTWTEELKQEYANKVFSDIEEYAPGFTESVIGVDILTPPDLERIFGLTGGNIFHGAMSLNQLYFQRPLAEHSNYRSPIEGLYMCGSGTHPGGGVMGASGKMAAMAALQDWKS